MGDLLIQVDQRAQRRDRRILLCNQFSFCVLKFPTNSVNSPADSPAESKPVSQQERMSSRRTIRSTVAILLQARESCQTLLEFAVNLRILFDRQTLFESLPGFGVIGIPTESPGHGTADEGFRVVQGLD